MKKTFFSTVLTSQFLVFIFLFFNAPKAMAQSYIDCATIITDADDYSMNSNNTPPSKVKNGYSYAVANTAIQSSQGTQSLPVINGDNYHNTSGDEDYDGYLGVFDPDCNQILGTYIGGEKWEFISDIEVDDFGNIYLGGITTSGDFPTTDGTSTVDGSYAYFIVKLAPNGTVIYATVLKTDLIPSFLDMDIVVDGTEAYFLGYNRSASLPTTDGSTLGSVFNGFVAKYDSAGNIVYLTQTGGLGFEVFLDGMIVNGCLVVLGIVQGAFSSTDGTTITGGSDHTLTKYDPNGNVAFSTVYGGSFGEADDGEQKLATDGTYIYVTAATRSSDFPTTDGSSFSGGTTDIYLRKYDIVGNLISSQLFGSSSSDSPTDLQVINGEVYLLSQAQEGMPVVNGLSHFGVNDAHLLKMDASGNIVYATYYGGGSSDYPNDFYVNSSGEAYLIVNGNNAYTTDGTIGSGSAVVKLNADGSICMATQLNDIPYVFSPACFEVIEDTLYIINTISNLNGGDNYTTDGTVALVDGYDLQVTKLVLCPAPTPITQDDLSPSNINVCQNGIIAQIIGEEQVIDGTSLPPVYLNGVQQAQAEIPLEYQWQISTTASGPWMDIAGPIANQKNYTPAPTTTDVYYRRQTKTAECCGETVVSTSTVTSVLVTTDIAPTVDGGGNFYICPGNSVMLDATITGGTSGFTYNWDNGLAAVEDPTATPAQSTVYTLQVTDANGCMQADQATVTIYQADAGTDSDVCDGAGTTIGGDPLAGVPIVPSGGTPPVGAYSIEYSWLPVTGLSCTDCPNPLATPSSMEDYTLTVILNYPDGTSCQTMDLITVDVITSPGSPLVVSDTVICLGDEIDLGTTPAPAGYTYIWAPGAYLSTNEANATFDAGSLEMPEINPISYTLSSTLGACTFYEQVSVAVIEARADKDGCGPRTIGEEDRTPSINETYSWAKITDAGITTGTGDFVGATNQAIVPVSASVGGNVGYELTVSYTLNGSTGICKDTVIVPTCECGAEIESLDGGCPDFDDGNPTLIGQFPHGSPSDWIFSWTSNQGMVGLNSYNTQIVNLTDNVNRTYYLSFASVIDPTYICIDSIEANSASFSSPIINATGVTICKGDTMNIGDPANNPGLTYSWTNASLLDDPTNSYPKASPTTTTEFIITAVDNITGCIAHDTVEVIVTTAANAGPDLNVCDNGTVTIGKNIEESGITYSWDPAGASWQNGTDQNDAMPDVFVATTQDFILTVNNGSCVTKDTVTVIVESLPPSFTLPDINYCPSQVDDLVLGTDDGTTTGINQIPNGYIYNWTPGNVSNPAAQNPIVNTPLPSASIIYDVEVRTPGGCNQKATQTINPVLSAPIVGNNNTICLGETVAIGDDTNPTGGTLSYAWTSSPDVNSELSSTTTINPTFTPTAAGTYTFTMTNTDSGLSCSASAEVTIIVIEGTSVPLIPQTICAGESVQIGTTDGAALQFEWNPITGLDDPFSANPIFSGTNSTNFTVTVIDQYGCSTETNTSVTVNPAPAIAITLPDTTLCDANATSIVINAGVAPAGSYAYRWSPSTNLDNANALNPTFFIPAAGSYEYILEVIDQSTGCSVFDTTVMNVSFNNIPEVVAFAIQSSCVDNNSQDDGYLQISSVSVGTHYSYSMGSTFTGLSDINNATSFNYNTDLPLKFGSLMNPTGSQDYTIRVFNGASDCYTDVVVTMNEQDCIMGCSCKDYIYLNDINVEGEQNGYVHKFEIVGDSLIEVQRTTGIPWHPPADNASTGPFAGYTGPYGELIRPHGLANDLNGFLYIGESETGQIRKLDCDGNILPESEFVINDGGFNVTSWDSLIFVNSWTNTATRDSFIIKAYSNCTGELVGKVYLSGYTPTTTPSNSGSDWGLYIDDDGTIYATAMGVQWENTQTDFYVWKFDIDINDFIAGNSIAPFMTTTDLPGWLSGEVIDNYGITTDEDDNIYTLIWEKTGDWRTILLKFDDTGTWVDSLNQDWIWTPVGGNDLGFSGGRGLIYFESTGTIYIGGGPNADCVARVDAPTMQYLGDAVVNIPGQNPKGIALMKECCPANNNIVIDTILCGADIGEVFFLQELISCEGIICEGNWTESTGNIGLSFNDCNNSVTITSKQACGSFELNADGTGNNAQCGAFKISINIQVGTTPEAKVFAIQPSCTDGVPQSDGYLQLSEITGVRFNWSVGSTYTGDPDFVDAIDTSGLTFPHIITSGLSNPAGSQDYTFRIFSDTTACGDGCGFKDITVTMNEQDCTVGCNCEEYVYLAEPAVGTIHKFKVTSSLPFTEVLNNGNPWYPGTSVSELPQPHAIGFDLNGNIYSSELGPGQATAATRIRKLNCAGDIYPASEFSIQESAHNMVIIGDIMFLNQNSSENRDMLQYFDLCTEAKIGEACFNNSAGTELKSWELTYNIVTGTFLSGNDGEIWRFTEQDIYDSFANGTCIDPLITMSTDGTVSVGDNEILLEAGKVQGLAQDDAGNIYILETLVGGGHTKILKYDSNGGYVASSITDTDVTDGGYSSAIGLVYDPVFDRLYTSNRVPDEDCISAFDTSLNYLGAAFPPVGGIGTSKAININTECCPTNNNITIDTILCATSFNDSIFLQDLINCDGNICAGVWQEGASNTGLTYNACNNSVTIAAAGNACGTFTLESDGTGASSECGAFKITVNIEVLSPPSVTLIPDSTICAGENILLYGILATVGMPTYQWQQSITSCMTGFTNIIEATDSTYLATPTDTTYYRLITSNVGNCASGNCADTSACVQIFVPDCDWGDLPDVTGATNIDDYQTTNANNGPVHVITPGLSLGSTVDGEPDGQPSTNALGDGADEDGITIFPTLDISPGVTFRLPLSYTNTTGMDAEVEAWIDWNANGEFDAGEMVFDATNPSVSFITVTAPSGAVTGEFLGVRIRISNEDNMTPYGRIESGEVEDYLIGLDCETQICIPMGATIKRE